eukprot:TRINITY_DN5264_c0_g1_i1.p1 TRINITY_DN5264_c0_g1~~TRINITY_DN5264_c0_g1_i1.p1  ORF type:complete len:575 (+),score=69.64 TRINITY_DN5264_c0_g1_i1:35-1726(+)
MDRRLIHTQSSPRNEIINFLLNTIPFLIILSGLIILLYVINGFYTNQVTYETVHIDVDDKIIIGTVAYPTAKSNKTLLPAVLVLHGVLASKEWMMYWVQSVAMNDIVCLTVDLPGHGMSPSAFDSDALIEEGIAALEYLSNLDYVDSTKLAGIGWGIGGSTLIEIDNASSIEFDSTILIGSPLPEGLNYSSEFPKNLLFGIGIVDELFGVDEILQDLNESVPEYNITSCDGKKYGSFQNGTARKCCTAYTDHVFEALDNQLISCSMEWLKESFFNTTESVYTRDVFGREVLSILAGVCCLSLYALIFFILKYDQEDGKIRSPHYQSYWWLIHGGISFFSMVLGALFIFLPFAANYYLIFIGWFLLSGISYAILYAKLHSNFGFKKVIFSPWYTSSKVKTGLVFFFFIVHHALLQFLFYKVPWSLNFGYPIFKSMYVADLFFKRYLLFFPAWLLSTIAFVYEIAVIDKVLYKHFKLWNFFYVVLSRLWLFFLMLIATVILSFLNYRLNGMTIMMLFLLPFTGIYITICLITQWGRYYGQPPINLAIITGGIFATMISSILNFNL